MSESVEGGASEESVGEGRAPFVQCEIACDDRGRGLVSLGDQFVEVFVLRGLEGFEAEVVDDEQGGACQGVESSGVGIDGTGLL